MDRMRRCGFYPDNSELGSVACFYECDDEFSGSIKEENFFTSRRTTIFQAAPYT
jgi:hypothetical protein